MLFELQIFSGKVYHPEPPHAQSLFLFPIVLVLIQNISWKKNKVVCNSHSEIYLSRLLNGHWTSRIQAWFADNRHTHTCTPSSGTNTWSKNRRADVTSPFVCSTDGVSIEKTCCQPRCACKVLEHGGIGGNHAAKCFPDPEWGSCRLPLTTVLFFWHLAGCGVAVSGSFLTLRTYNEFEN